MSIAEIDFAQYRSNPSMLESSLQKLTLSSGIELYTFLHYSDLPQTWEEYYQKLKNSFGFKISDGDIIVDIGAHHGIVTLNCAHLGAKVFAFEPHPINFEILKRNVLLNSRLDIQIECQAVFSQSGQVQFNFGKTSTTGALLDVGRDWKRTDQNVTVEAVSFGDLFKSRDLDEVKLMKIDCEGGEYEFLMKTDPNLIRKVDFYYIEAHPTKSENPAQLKTFLEKSGYDVKAYPTVHNCFDFVCQRIDLPRQQNATPVKA